MGDDNGPALGGGNDPVSAPPPSDPKATLHRYLRDARQALLWKLDGLSEYDIRRPMTPTGTNLLGLVKHTASVELGYLGDTFGRPSEIELPWFAEDAEDNADMWATSRETREDILGLYHAVWAHTDETIRLLPLDAPGRVPWWAPEKANVTLHQILVHMVTETQRHAGQADIVREMIDGAVGLFPDRPNMPAGDAQWWTDYVARLEEAAGDAARQVDPGGRRAGEEDDRRAR